MVFTVYVVVGHAMSPTWYTHGLGPKPVGVGATHCALFMHPPVSYLAA